MSSQSASTQSDPILRLSGISHTFQSTDDEAQVLRDVNLEVGEGEFVALIGHSGCGKSTLLNIMAGLVLPTAGEATFEAEPITGPGPDRAMVFQNYSLLPWLNVHENVFTAVDSVLTQATPRLKHDVTSRFLHVVGLGDQAKKRPRQLSGGMRQRVAVARAFAVHPKLLLLDEPFGALDALTKASLQDELLKLRDLGPTTESVVMVTHDIDEAIYLADRIVVLSNGPSATIAEELTVDLPRPRDRRGMVGMRAYAELKDRLLYLLTGALAREIA
jgi:nitrate ABC transporter ATP-binding subunit